MSSVQPAGCAAVLPSCKETADAAEMSALNAADEATVKRELEAMGVECIEPASEREQATAALMEAFAAFVLEEQPQRSLAMLEANEDGSVGELQGGSEHAI